MVAVTVGVALSLARAFGDYPSVGRVALAAGAGAAGIAGGVWARQPRGGEARNPALGEVMADAGVALLAGAVLGLVLLPIEEDRVRREERRDNVRFVREVATQPAPASKPFAGLDLRDAHLIGLDLSGADFAGADLPGASLGNGDLTGADFTGADLPGANFSHADLTGADFDIADLTGAYLGFADLTDASLSHADLTDATLRDTNLTGADLFLANLSGADLTRADLTDANLTDIVYDDETDWPEGFDPPPSGTARVRV